MDQVLLTTAQFNNVLQDQNEFIRTCFNITLDSEIGIMENQIIFYNILCSVRWILLTHIVMLFVIALCLCYVMKLLEKLVEERETPSVNAYIELKDPISV